MSEFYLGSHLSLSGPDFYLGTVKTALSFNENAFMFYTGAPQNTKRVPTKSLKIEEGRKLLQEQHIDESKIVIHAPYIINLANPIKMETRDLAKSFLKEELQRVADFHVQNLVLHPGSATGGSKDEAIRYLIEGLNEVLEMDSSNVIICLETMAGKGSEIGSNFLELAKIIKSIKKQDRIGVCLDTCHINDAGYDVNDIETTLSEFEQTIGLKKLKVIHLNDSKNERGSHKDRHENIGYGSIGFETLEKWVKEERLSAIPKILETPVLKDGANSYYPYKKEVEMLRSGIYCASWKEEVLKDN